MPEESHRIPLIAAKVKKKRKEYSLNWNLGPLMSPVRLSHLPFVSDILIVSHVAETPTIDSRHMVGTVITVIKSYQTFPHLGS